MTRDGTPFGEDIQALLVERLRAGLWLFFCGIAVFAVGDPFVHPDKLWPLAFMKLLDVTAVLLSFAMLHGPHARERAVAVAILFICVLSASSAASGIITNDAATTPILLSAIGMGTATLLPWGVRAQLVTQMVAGFCVLWNVASVDGGKGVTYVPVAVLIGSFASVYAAYMLERYRRDRRRA